jgi:hypothetical protein
VTTIRYLIFDDGVIALTRHRDADDFTASELRFLHDSHAFLESVHQIAAAGLIS